jgi:hypothetical protein
MKDKPKRPYGRHNLDLVPLENWILSEDSLPRVWASILFASQLLRPPWRYYNKKYEALEPVHQPAGSMVSKG